MNLLCKQKYTNVCVKMADNNTDLASAPGHSGKVGRPQKNTFSKKKHIFKKTHFQHSGC